MNVSSRGRGKERAVRSFQIAPIAYTNELIGGNVSVVLTGWGYTTQIRWGQSPNDLQQLRLHTVTNDECNSDGIYTDATGICTLAPFGEGSCGVMGDGQQRAFVIWVR